MLDGLYFAFHSLIQYVYRMLDVATGSVTVGNVTYTSTTEILATMCVGAIALMLLVVPFALLFKLVNFVTGGYSR